jgi:diacylglycerol kinase family enzyme
VAVVAALAALWRYRQIYTLQMELDGKPVTIRTPLLFLGLNSLQLENLQLEIARCTEEGLLAVIALQPTSRWHMLGLALRGALTGLHDSPDLRCFGASRVEVSQDGRRRTRVAVDGESIDCDLPLHFAVQLDALQVMVPRDPEERK